MSSNATPRIVIKDLPPIEQMSEEEMANTFGAGRFQPTFEVLEDRQLMSVSVSGISATPFSPNNSPGIRDTTAITVKHAGIGTDYNLKVLIESGSTVIRTLDVPLVNPTRATAETVIWDGKDDAGAFVADGHYNALAQYNAGAATGKLTTSPSKSMLIDNTAPNAPTNLALKSESNLTNKNKPTIIGNAEAGSTVKLYNGNTLVGSGIATSTGTFSITPSTNLANGENSLTATATDAAGNTGSSSTPLVVEIALFLPGALQHFKVDPLTSPVTPQPILARAETWISQPAQGTGGISVVSQKPAQQLVLRSAKELFAGTGMPETELAKLLQVSAINWKTQMVLVVSQGIGDYGPSSPSVKITGVQMDNNSRSLTIDWHLEQPNPDDFFLTFMFEGNPAVAVLVNRYDGPVTFHQDSTVILPPHPFTLPPGGFTSPQASQAE